VEQSPRFRIDYVPTYVSCFNKVERWFVIVAQYAILGGSFASESVDPQDHTVRNGLKQKMPPFNWTASAAG
jgi:hypothetical protein